MSYENQVVVISHPVMDTHVIAHVEKQTAHKVKVRYWKEHRNSWSEESGYRNIETVVKALGSIDQFTDQYVSEKSRKLRLLDEQRFQSIKQARINYQQKLKDFT